MALKPTLPKLYTVLIDWADTENTNHRYGICFDYSIDQEAIIVSTWDEARQAADDFKLLNPKMNYFICEITHAPIRNQNRNNG